MIIFVKNISLEGPETLGIFFQRKGYQTREIDLQRGDPLPAGFKDVEALVVLGGPMNVYEEDKYPYLKEEDALIKSALAQEIPYMGICLGAQLLAKACGARVGRSPQEEIGFSTIRLTKGGKTDPLFKGLEEEVGVFQWHGDMFEIPEGCQLLASSEGCPHQAFRAGPCAYGLQFHVEVTDKSIREWMDAYFNTADPSRMAQKKQMFQDCKNKREQFNRIADKIYENFLEIILKCAQEHKSTSAQDL
ncbi:MAG: hypothetical protein A3G91_05685 [Omnitrophica WOR_2 bacterium RIFCSPLOWO2_12_FULL_50_9]|nr:MAG: hypothetical protein A3D87_03015 [Omnitrophica WOR_2 bacterium RIFCSPHIGHO2_02_FULL_50_17]OGX41987.1 MAG: hypothetical protein A3G91_05685 [Omnitrophica WOR_2 bacterium RIFCSPLOWO2_12_FULL_50_9]